MTKELKQKLIALADKYETKEFYNGDPSQFLLRYGRDDVCNTEAAAFIAAMLSFGSRAQFIPKINQILTIAESQSGTVSSWLKSGSFRIGFPCGEKKFYRFYSYDDMQIFFEELSEVLCSAKTFGDFFRKLYEENFCKKETLSCCGSLLAGLISDAFKKSAIVPKGKTSANKRIHMFLRWMVRQNSPVDVGFWNWGDPSKLIIPLDIHVLQEAVKLELIPEGSAASFKTARTLTQIMNQVFPGDPSRADFALFGLGVDK